MGAAAYKAVDGCSQTSWGDGGCCALTNWDLNPWWQIDLGDIHAIFRIVIILRTDCKFTQKESKNFT